MNVQKVINEFQEKYPGRRIIKNMDENPTEIICEIEPTSDHPDYSIIVAVIDRSIPHYHKITTEEYKVIKGVFTVYKGDRSIILHEGESITIDSNVIHHAEGQETFITCTAKPGWTKEDHFLTI